MSFLDLATRDRPNLAAQPGEATDLPVTFGQGFEAAWHESTLFGQSMAEASAHTQALQDYVDEVRRKTGQDIYGDAFPVEGSNLGEQTVMAPAPSWQGANAAVSRLKAQHPDWDIAPLSDQEIEDRAVAVSRAARTEYAETAARERASGGGAGLLAGGLLGGISDPINIAAAPIGGGEAGILLTGIKFAGVAAASQAANELLSAGYREQVQPGYLESPEPLENVAQAAGSGFALGVGGKTLGLALGRAWRTLKMRTWPTDVRDAGNILESEANIHDSNVYPGLAGEVAHREALTGAIDNVVHGEPVDVSHIITPDLEAQSRALMTRLEGERAMSLPIFDERDIRLTSEEAGLRDRDAVLQSQMESIGEGSPAAAERLAAVQQVEDQLEGATGNARKALARRRDELLAGATPEQLRAQAHPLEVRRQAEAERASIAARLGDIAQERARVRAEQLTTAPPAPLGQTQPVRAVPFEQVRTAAGALTGEQGTAATEALRNSVGQIAERGGHFLPPEQIAALADRFAKMAPEDAAGAARELQVAPHQLERRFAEPPAEPVLPEPVTTAPERAEALADPGLDTAMRADLDRLRMLKDAQIPIGVDERGNAIMGSLDKELADIDDHADAAGQLEACANPAPEPAEPAA